MITHIAADITNAIFVYLLISLFFCRKRWYRTMNRSSTWALACNNFPCPRAHSPFGRESAFGQNETATLPFSQRGYTLCSFLCWTLQGLPKAVTPSGISETTTLPAPIITSLPIFTPWRITLPAPIHVPSPISTPPVIVA